MKIFKRFLKELLSAIYPNKCIGCGEIIDTQKYLCNNCNSNIERVNLNDICTDCGLEKDNCVCKYNVYRFNSLITVFKNIGIARNSYYSYKFGKKQFYVKFFAEEMTDSIKKCYSDIEFDFICAVPCLKGHKYDHSGYIANEIAKAMGITYKNDLLVCNKKVKSQHKSTFKERMNNVDGKYSYNYKIDNATVLLVDDIKTTGATIDECARILLFAGAKSVYCITALGSISQENKN